MENIILVCFTTADWINFIIAIATLITACIALFTVNEIRKQREHTYHPDINMSNFSFYVYKRDEDEFEEEGVKPENLIYLYYSKKQLEKSSIKNGYNELVIEIDNIGFGVAKEISWEWDFDLSKAKKAIGLKDNDKWEVEDGFLSVTFPELNIDWICLIDEDNYGDKINFILPYSKENTQIEIRIPNYFLDLYWLYKLKDTIYNENTEDYPPLRLSVSYTNIHGKKFEKTFLLHLSYHFISNPFSGNKDYEISELGKFRFEIKEVE